MKYYLGVSPRSIKRQKITSILIIIAISLSVAMVQSLLILSGSIKSTVIIQAEKSAGRHHAQLNNLRAEQTESIIADSRIEEYGFINGIGTAFIAGRNVSLIGVDESAAELLALKLIDGEYPDSAGEIALEKRIIENMGLALLVPQTISFPVSVYRGDILEDETTETFALTGILENHVTGAVIPRGWCSAEQAGESRENNILLRYENNTDPYTATGEIAEALGISADDIHINDILLDALGASESDINEGVFAGAVVGGLVIISACFVIMNIFNVSVTQRKRQFAMLRCTGATVGQVRLIVIAEGLILSVIGVALGLIIGIASAKAVAGAVGTVISPGALNAETQAEAAAVMQSQASPSALSVLSSAAIGLFMTVFSALLPSFSASRAAPVYALSNAAPAVNMKSRKREKRVGNVLWYCAKLNLSRNRRRTAFTVMTLTLSMIIFIAMTSFAGAVDPLEAVSHMMESDFTLGASADYITGPDPQSYLSQSDIETIRSLPGVERVRTKHSIMYITDGSEESPATGYEVKAYDNATLQEFLDELGTGAPTLNDMENLPICLTRDKTEIFSSRVPGYTSLSKNESAVVFGRELTVAGVLSGEEFGAQYSPHDIIVTEARIRELTGRSDILRADIFLSDSAAAEQIQNVRSALKSIQRNNQSLVLTDFEEIKAELEESAESLKRLVYGLVAVIGIIGILGIINTMYTSVHARTPELGTSRAIGETKGQLVASIMFEGAQYGIYAALTGVPLGILLSAAVVSASNGLENWTVPFVPAVLAAVCVVAACMAAAMPPLRRIMKMSIVESIGGID